MNYLRTHWRGEQSFAWSFWINLVLLRAAIFWLEGFTGPLFAQHPRLLAAATVLFFVFFHIVVYAWQIIGVLRAGDRYLQRYGSSIWVPAAHVGVIATLILTSVSGFAATQTLFIRKPERNLMEEWERERAARYILRVSPNGRFVSMNGQFELGLTRGLTAILEENPGIEGIVLNSDGGYVVEGRGVARLIKTHGLDTYVFGTCKSACTIAFIGGARRMMGTGGRLGFHQYALELGYPDKLLDPGAEQDRDRRFFAEQGIKANFLELVFDRPHQEIWFPDPRELVAAGVVHRILNVEPEMGGDAGIPKSASKTP